VSGAPFDWNWDGPAAQPRPPQGSRGLCPPCAHVRTIESARGSTFYLCGRASSDPRYAKYPNQPVVACPGFAPRSESASP